MSLLASKFTLNSDDVKQIVSHPDRDVRAMLTQKICRKIKMAKLSEREQTIVTEILKLVAKDAAAIVRRALAVTLKNSPNLPKEIALKLIRDVDSIAVPVLSHSPVLSDEDLLEILKSKAATKMMAITKRPQISGDLVKAIIRFGDSKIVASVAANDGAAIGIKLGNQILDIYHDNDLIKESFICRRDLPAFIVEKLITMVSAEAAIRLNERHEVPIEIAIDIAGRSRERAQIDFISQSWISRDVKALTKRLHDEDRLTNSLIVRAACCGQMRFAEQGLACKTGVSLSKAVLMMHDSGPFGLKALCGRAGLKNAEYVLLRACVVIYRDIEFKGGAYSKEKFQSLMLERVLSLPIVIVDADMDYLLDKLDALNSLAA